MAYYRNRETGIVQYHPKSGLGDSFNAEEIGEDGKPVKPYVPLGTTRQEAARRRKLATDPKAPAASRSRSTKKQKGDQ